MLSITLQVLSPYFKLAICFLLEYCGTVRNLCTQQVLPSGTGSVELLMLAGDPVVATRVRERYEHLSSYRTDSNAK